MKRKLIAIALSLCLLLPVLAIAVQAETAPAYTIGNPYASVNWGTWEQYKTQLHVHTDASDGAVPKDEVIEIHYELDYDILAITDHMTMGVAWDQVPRTVPIMRMTNPDRTGMRFITPLTPERRLEITTGSGPTRDGRARGPMLEVTQGNELNGAVFSNNHLNGFFTEYGQGKLGVDGDWLRPVRGVHADGGLTVINHPGDVHRAYEDDDPLTFFDRNPRWIDKFAYLFVNYDSSVGMDISSGWDGKTKYDRLLYDRIIEKTIPHGVLPWIYTYSDAHSPGEFDRGWTVHLMPDLTVPALRKSMEDGTFFGFSRSATFEMPDGFRGEGPAPRVSNIAVDQAAGTITIAASEYTEIVWTTNRTKEVARGATLDIAEYGDEIGTFVRAYLIGPGGVLYVQPFTILRAGETLEKECIRNPFDYSWLLGWWADFGTFAKTWFPPWRAVWWVTTQFDPALDAPWLADLLYNWVYSRVF